MTIQDRMDSALTVVVIQRADTRTPMTMMAVVIGDELDLAPLLPRRPSGTAAAAAVAIARSLHRRRFEARDYYVAAFSLEEKRGTGVKPCRILRID
jgi:hypothetical protein